MKSLLCLLFHTPVALAWADGDTVNKQIHVKSHKPHTYVHSALKQKGELTNDLTFSGNSLTENI